MTRVEYSKAHGISIRTIIRRIRDGQLKEVVKNRKSYIMDESEQSGPSANSDMATLKLKDEKIAEEIKLLRLKNKDMEEMIRSDERAKFKERVFIMLRGIPESYRKIKLTEEQSKIITEAYAEGIKRLEQLKT